MVAAALCAAAAAARVSEKMVLVENASCCLPDFIEMQAWNALVGLTSTSTTSLLGSKGGREWRT